MAQIVKNLPVTQEAQVRTLEEEAATHSSILAWEFFQEQRSLVDYSPWGHKESDMTKQLNTTANIKQKQAVFHNSKGFNTTCMSMDRLSRQKANTEILL